MSHLSTQFEITSSMTFDGHKLWGFHVPSLYKGQRPCWHTKREAVESAKFHIEQWAR
jgi:hypothetical protein